MTETLLVILAIELGLILFAMVGVFGLDTLAMLVRNKENKAGPGTLRIMTPEEMLAHGLNPKDFMNPTPKTPVEAPAASGQYL